MAELKELDVRVLFPHPQNPRKSLGELEELAESIRQNGILQNLTVVPKTSALGNSLGYTVIIGHRRLEAAKLAGIATVPCVVAEMNEREQLSTMLMENMQRSDLTVYEQAEGFQLMLDMGESVKEIADRSGFSESTIRRRVKLLDLDRDKLKAAELRGGTLQDYAELDKIKDSGLKNQVLESIGTRDFDNKLARAIEVERKQAILSLWEAEVNQWATRVEAPDGGMSYVTSYNPSYDKEAKKPKLPAGTELFYTFSNGNIYIYKKLQKTKEKKAPDEELNKAYNRRVEERRAQLNEVADRHRCLRERFVKGFAAGRTIQDAKSLLPYVVECMVDRRVNRELFAKITGIEVKAYYDSTFPEKAEAATEHNADMGILAAMYACLETRGNPVVEMRDLRKYELQHLKNKTMERLYRILESLGYETSREEREMLDGSHELFGEIV